jgi:hypothetical protein
LLTNVDEVIVSELLFARETHDLRFRFFVENLSRRAVLLFADPSDIQLLPKVGYQWMAIGKVVEIVTPGLNHKRYRSGCSIV